jgi:hypothetical protein
MLSTIWARLIAILLATHTLSFAGASSFPRLSDFGGSPFSVNYTERALTLNGSAALFLSGSIHPPRLSIPEWDIVMNDAVKAGLNMIEVYVCS